MNRKYRSAIAKLRSGILPLEIEVGRWKGLDLEQSLCKFCDTQAVKDEYHFVFECSLYHEERSIYTDKLGVENVNILDRNEKWKTVMMRENVVETAKFV